MSDADKTEWCPVHLGSDLRVELAPAPSFSGGGGVPTLATIYGSHYMRLVSVLDAARTGNEHLIKLAVEHQDRLGWADEK